MYEIDPLRDERWAELLQKHPLASAFHTPGWMSALHETYGYRPVAFTSSGPGRDLEDGIAFCEIDSWLTGRRMVSMPFSDHCDPLVDSECQFHALIGSLERYCKQKRLRYMELRPSVNFVTSYSLRQSESFYLHRIDLRPGLPDIYRRFHSSCVKRHIGRAEREGLKYEVGNSPELLEKFYRLQVATRLRHRVPPQPLAWFRNILECMGNMIEIRVASSGQVPVASALSLRFGGKVIYKYACSDRSAGSIGGVQMLMWRLIQDSKQAGAVELDLGRSEPSNTGLSQFKERWGAERISTNYWRYNPKPHSEAPRWQSEAAKKVISRCPSRLLVSAGALLYKHAA